MPGDAADARREPAGGPDAALVLELLDGVAAAAAARGREDLGARLATVRDRVLRSETVICVVGEFKQGKSALINGLLTKEVCPVDDDLATMAVTIVRHADRPGATVRRREGGQLVVESIPADEIADWVTERANPDNRRNVELVEVAISDPFLERGLTFVDTPGVGGLNAAHAAATLAFLPLADALVFVTDASAELTLAELEFLARARDAGPPVLLALTKIDMYPEWRRILSIDERRLQAAGLDLDPFPLSAALRTEARELDDRLLERESGYPAFVEALADDVAPRAESASVVAALRELRGAIDQLREPINAELAALERPEAAEAMAADLERVRERLAGLAEAGSDWSVRLDDEFGSLRARTGFAIQGQMRRILRDASAEIERIDPGRAWSEFSQEIQSQVAAAVRAAFLEVTEGAAGIQAAIADLLAADELALREPDTPVEFDVRSLWKGGQVFEGTLRTGAIAGFGLLAGATVGVEMLGMLGALLGTALVGPALLGAALFFGGKEVAAERRRLLTDRRQQARTFVAEFIESAQFEVEGRLASLASELQRQMRARFAERIRELMRTYQEAATALERAMEHDQAERAGRLTELRAELEDLDLLGRRLEVLEESASRAA